MSDEEKKAIDLLKNIDKQKCMMLECPVVKNNIERQLKIIELNRTIRKQSKEIEELKEKHKSQPDCVEPIERTEEMVNMNWVNHNYISKEKSAQKEKEVYNFGYRNGCNDTSKFNDKTFIRIDKIKAEIEELQEDIKYSANPLSIDNSKFGIKVLQSLLEKE